MARSKNKSKKQKVKNQFIRSKTDKPKFITVKSSNLFNKNSKNSKHSKHSKNTNNSKKINFCKIS